MLLARWIICALVGVGVVFAQTDRKLSAREIFYSPAAKAAEPKPPDPKPSKAVQRAPKAPARTPEVTHESTSPALQQTKPLVTLASLTRKPLGVRLSILKIGENGQTSEMPPDTSFQPGERVRLSLQFSENGYLYIINRGSSGTWTQLFPSPELPDASNVVVPGVTYSVPPDRNFVISDPPGEEKLFIILSRQPELDVDALTMDMSRRDATGLKELPAPKYPLETRIAANLPSMNDAMVDRLRNVYARDLIIEKVDPQTPGNRKENAIYAVNPSGGDDTRVVLDAQIKHR